MKSVSPPNAFQQRMLEEASREIARIDGKSITGLDKQLLYLRASDRPEDRKLLLGLYQDAIEADSAWWQSAVLECMDYKAHWGPIFRARRALGLSTPRQFPDPDDIVILSPTRFTFIGPVTEEEAAEWQFFKKGRETFVMVANEIIEAAGWYRPLEDDRQAYLKVRRHYYRVTRLLPDAFKRKHPLRFPAFMPSKVPPDWYRGYDEWIDPETGEWVRSDSRDAGVGGSDR